MTMTDTTQNNQSLATTKESRPWRRDPQEVFTELEAEMDRLFGPHLPSFLPLRRFTSALGGAWAPSTDVFEKDGDLVIKAELPGVSKDAIDVSVEQGNLIIKGERKAEEEVKEEKYYRSERFTGSYYRRYPLPEGVDETTITATYTDGVLEVHVPRPVGDEAKPAVLKVPVH